MTALAVSYPSTVSSSAALTFRAHLDRRFQDIKRPFDSYRELYRELAEYNLPSRPRFAMTDKLHRGSKGNQSIVDNTGTRALNKFRSGMLAGLADSSSVWFELATVRPGLNENKEVAVWLRRVRDILLAIFDRSNLYTGLALNWGDQGLFGTGTTLLFEDDETVFRTESLAPGCYYLSQDDRNRVDTVVRDMVVTPRQLVSMFGEASVSESVRQAVASGSRMEGIVEARHAIWPMPENGYNPAGWRWQEVYWEKGTGVTEYLDELSLSGNYGGVNDPGNGVLFQGGYYSFPAAAGRWDRNDDEVWCARCPGIDSLGDTKMLQTMVRAFMNGLNKMVNPPIVGGPGLEATAISMLAGGKTIDPSMMGAGTGARELHQIRLPLDQAWAAIQNKQQDITDTWLVPMFQAFLTKDGIQPLTQEETIAWEREKAKILGPIQTRQADEVLDPVISRALDITVRRSIPNWQRGVDGILPIPPEIMLEEPIRVRYVSEVAQTQRAVSIGALERHVGFVSQIAQINPEILDGTDWDRVSQEHAEATGVPPSISRTNEEIQSIRQARLEQQQAMAMREQLPQMASAVKDLSQAKTGQDSALDKITAAGG